MKNRYKYIMNMGLAFDEERAMKKLSQMAKEGWILDKMTLFRYRLRKAEPKKLIYTMDYNNLDENKEEYFEIFKGSGWKHMCSYGAFHFFAAPPKNVPIYTDKETYLNKYGISNENYKKTLIISLITFVTVVLIKFLLRNIIRKTIINYVLIGIATIALVLAVPSLMVSTAYYIKKKRILKGKTKIF